LSQKQINISNIVEDVPEVIHEIHEIWLKGATVDIYDDVSIVSLNVIPCIPTVEHHRVKRLHYLS